MGSEKILTLITGGNAGLGFEVAAQLLTNASNHIILGSRSKDKGDAAVKDLQSRGSPGSVELIVLDVNSHESIVAAAQEVEKRHGRLDNLVNNAGIATLPENTPVHEKLKLCFATNVIGPALMVEQFAPLLLKSSTPRIINVTSGQGSIARRLDTTHPTYNMGHSEYRVSKAALNMLNACQSAEYGGQGIKVLAVAPGFTVSNLAPMNAQGGGGKPTAEGARVIVDAVNGERDGEHGAFLQQGGQIPW